MENENQLIICVSAVTEENVYYIFRTNGAEVRIEMINNQFKANKELTIPELEYLNNNLR